MQVSTDDVLFQPIFLLQDVLGAQSKMYWVRSQRGPGTVRPFCRFRPLALSPMCLIADAGESVPRRSFFVAGPGILCSRPRSFLWQVPVLSVTGRGLFCCRFRSSLLQVPVFSVAGHGLLCCRSRSFLLQVEGSSVTGLQKSPDL